MILKICSSVIFIKEDVLAELFHGIDCKLFGLQTFHGVSVAWRIECIHASVFLFWMALLVFGCCSLLRKVFIMLSELYIFVFQIMVKSTQCLVQGILDQRFHKCLSVLQSSFHFPFLMIPFHSSTMSFVWSSSFSSRFTSTSHPNALRLAPPQGSRLLVTAEQCANQLAHNKCVHASNQVEPQSLCFGAGAFLPCNWIEFSEKKLQYVWES